ncbi:MAG: hypothetical protein HY316_08390, partial [Acidobacteria bacterium]|nr:hypothetical protein [Acidobacteriota bacterium]
MPSKKDATSPKPAEVAVERPLLYEVLEQSPAMPASPKKAVLITHGMGQQKEFETLNQVVAGLRRAAEASGGTLRQKVRFVQIGQERLYRVELELQSQGKKQEVDLYEAYWAPLTEGNVSLRDVVRFLWSAGVSGILNFFHPPTQQRFGQQVPMPPTRKTLGHLLLALVLLLSLIVMNASIIAVGAARSVFTNESAWLSEALFSDLSVIFNILLIFVVPTGAVLMLASIRKAAGAPDQGGFSPAGRRLTWTYLCLTGAATVILGLWNLAVLVADRPR